MLLPVFLNSRPSSKRKSPKCWSLRIRWQVSLNPPITHVATARPIREEQLAFVVSDRCFELRRLQRTRGEDFGTVSTTRLVKDVITSFGQRMKEKTHHHK
ncbi:hypothetical protein PIB30_088757 [Stylosanthes scabra]|uniref:Uncharacterized protein n=1 Tax=Stylosanthes scabra TaxID=79078 RepID=A0ABU6YT17_9FABA|nr:hypothetical protein [Stylosanthes scabra]